MEQKLKNFAAILSRILGFVGMVAIVSMMVVMCVDVALRYIFNSPLLWSYTAVEYFMVLVVYLGISYTELHDGHVNISIFTDRLTPKRKLMIDIVNCLIMLVISVIIAVEGWKLTIDSLRVGRTAVGPVKIPEAPADATIFIGGAVLSILIASKIVSNISQLFQRIE